MEANFFMGRGMYTEAIASYLRALDHEEAAPYAEYGLGSAYFSLEEGAAALERFADAEKALEGLPPEEHGELRYRLRYNRGVLQFEGGDYGAAAASFRKALEIDGRRREAKRNLELSLLALDRESSSPAAVSGAGDPAEQERQEVLFDYIRMKERDQWKNREWIEEDEAPGPDY